MRWTIGILTIPSRWGMLDRLVGNLNMQIAELGVADDVEILVASQDGGIGEKRQWCLDTASGLYFNFVDDDDQVADDYVRSIYPLLTGEVDYIGFRLQLFWNNHAMKPTFHSLQYDRWYEDAQGYYRNITHLNPMKTEIARQGRFDRDYAEDLEWSKQVKPETEYYIPRTMYFYFYEPANSAANRLAAQGGT